VFPEPMVTSMASMFTRARPLVFCTFCAFSVTVPTPATVSLVFGAGLAETALPAILRSASEAVPDPVGPPVPPSDAAAVVEMAPAVMAPFSRLTLSIVALELSE
jgi:hypothetical protein